MVEAVHDGCPGPAGAPVVLSTGGCNVLMSCKIIADVIGNWVDLKEKVVTVIAVCLLQ